MSALAERVVDRVAAAPARRKVALFASNFLPYSQTFIFDEISRPRRYGVEVFAAQRQHADRFPFAPVHVGDWRYRRLNHAPAFAAKLRTGGFSLVHAHFGVGGARAAPFARAARLPLVITFHGYDVPLLTSVHRFRPEHLGYALTAARTVREDMTLGLCASEELYEMLRDYGVPAARLRLYRLGIDLAAFAPAPRTAGVPEVIAIGRFVEKKGFEYAIRAVADQVARGARLRFTIVGDGERGPRLREMVAALGLAACTTFTGALPAREVAARLRGADVLLAPSVTGLDGDRESGLIAVKEASASGVVPIGTWHGGIHEIIDDGATGFLVPERSVTALSDRLGRLLADPALRARMAAAARAKMEREYDLAHRLAALDDHYDEAVALHAAR